MNPMNEQLEMFPESEVASHPRIAIVESIGYAVYCTDKWLEDLELHVDLVFDITTDLTYTNNLADCPTIPHYPDLKRIDKFCESPMREVKSYKRVNTGYTPKVKSKPSKVLLYV
jgi:hypothetical protein